MKKLTSREDFINKHAKLLAEKSKEELLEAIEQEGIDFPFNESLALDEAEEIVEAFKNGGISAMGLSNTSALVIYAISHEENLKFLVGLNDEMPEWCEENTNFDEEEEGVGFFWGEMYCSLGEFLTF